MSAQAQLHRNLVRRLGLATACSLLLAALPALTTPAAASSAKVTVTGHPSSVPAVYQANGAAPVASVVVKGLATAPAHVVLQRLVGRTWHDVGKAAVKHGSYAVIGRGLPIGLAHLRVVRAGSVASKAFSVPVTVPKPISWPSGLPTPYDPTPFPAHVALGGFAGAAEVGYSVGSEVQAKGGTPPYRFTVLSRLPRGVHLAANGAVLGIPTQSGRWTLSVRVTDAAGQTAAGSYAFVVALPVVAPPQTLHAKLGVAFHEKLQAFGGFVDSNVGGLNWNYSLSPAPLPGLSVENDGTVDGTPTLRGTHVYPVFVSDQFAGVNVVSAVTMQVSPWTGKHRTLRVPGQYATITAAIAKAHDGDTVLVGPGTYRENLDFAGKDIIVRSSAGPARTVIDGGGRAVSLPAVSFTHGETHAAVLRGFTVRNGWSRDYGGGIHILLGSPQILDNVVEDNRAQTAAAGIGAFNGWTLIEHNVVRRNSGYETRDSGGGIEIGGAGLSAVVGNDIYGNSVGGLDGSGLRILSGVALANRVHGNGDRLAGSAVDFDGPGVLADNVVYDNDGTAGVVVEGGALLADSSLVVSNTVTAGATATALELRATQNTSLVDNALSASAGHKPLDCTAPTRSPVYLHRNDVYAPGVSGPPADCAGSLSQADNLWKAPKFVNAAKHDFRPATGSPLIDAGTTLVAPGLRLDQTTDIAGHRRIVDGDKDSHAVIDIGAYERQ